MKIKNMTSKMTTNSQLSTNEPKRKENNHNRNRIREMDITQREFSGEGEGRKVWGGYREEAA